MNSLETPPTHLQHVNGIVVAAKARVRADVAWGLPGLG